MLSATHRYRSRIEFADTDASGVMHFASIFRYVEAAEHDYLIRQGVVVHEVGHGGWPRVHLDCDYERPLHARDEIEVVLHLAKVGTSSLVWDFEVRKVEAGEIAIHGHMVTVRTGPSGRPQEISEQERKVLC